MLIILLVISILMPSKSVFKRNSVVKLILIMCNKCVTKKLKMFKQWPTNLKYFKTSETNFKLCYVIK